MSANLDILRVRLQRAVKVISDGLPSNYQLTLVARHVGHIDADIVATEDNPLKAADVLTRLHALAVKRDGLEDLKKGEARFMHEIAEQCVRLMPDGFAYLVIAKPGGVGAHILRYISNCERSDMVCVIKDFLARLEADGSEAGGTQKS